MVCLVKVEGSFHLSKDSCVFWARWRDLNFWIGWLQWLAVVSALLYQTLHLSLATFMLTIFVYLSSIMSQSLPVLSYQESCWMYFHTRLRFFSSFTSQSSQGCVVSFLKWINSNIPMYLFLLSYTLLLTVPSLCSLF